MSSFDIIKENMEIYRKGEKAKKKIVEEINNILSLNKEYAEFFGTEKLDRYEDLHRALKVANQLILLEDSILIYRLTRAPERRIFYIDVGNLPPAKAEEHIEDIVEVELDEETDKIIITEEYPVWGGETENDYYFFPIKWISDETALKEAIQKDKEEKERKRIAEEETKRQKEIEKEKKKQDEEYQQYLKLKEKFKDID